MRPHVFTRLVEAVQNVDPYFHFKYDAIGKAGLSTLQNYVTTFRILAYSLPADTVDEYVRIGESTAHECLNHECLNHFCAAIINVFGQQYVRAPTTEDVDISCKDITNFRLLPCLHLSCHYGYLSELQHSIHRICQYAT
jgi:hypothetical protein